MKKDNFIDPKEPKKFFPDPNMTFLSEVVDSWEPEGRADVGIVGIPFDGGIVSHRRGTRLAPGSIRDEMYKRSTYNLDLDADISNLKIVDCGDVDVAVGNYQDTHSRVESALNSIFQSGLTPIIIGGDHSLTFPAIKAAISEVQGQIGLIDFDSHLDLRTGWQENCGLWVREIQEMCDYPVSGENIVQIGIHGFEYSKYYREAADDMGIKIYRPKEVRERDIEQIVHEALSRAAQGTNGVYVSVDIDVVSASYAPGTNAPSHCGLTPIELINGVVELARHQGIIGLDLMEVSPPLDNKGMTVALGADVLMHFLGGLSIRKANEGN